MENSSHGKVANMSHFADTCVCTRIHGKFAQALRNVAKRVIYFFHFRKVSTSTVVYTEKGELWNVE